MTTKKLHIIEPTLANQAGHCYSYVRSLVRAHTNRAFDLHVWLDRRAKTLFQEEKCCIHACFFRKLMKIQMYFRLRSLLKSNESIFIPTASRMYLLFLSWLLRKGHFDQTIFLHFHQFKVTPEKMKLLCKVAKAHPEFIIMAPTEKLLTIFREAGFPNCEHVACPGYESRSKPSNQAAQCQKLIYAGAARLDKGFPQIVDYIEYATHQTNPLPIEVQISPPSSGRYDCASKKAIAKLNQLPHSTLTLHAETLDRCAYQNLFDKAIALLLYERDAYANKFSGVALDSFYAGCPLVTIAGTWAGDMVKRFDAGVVLNNPSSQNIHEAVQFICHDYAHYHENAKHAGEVLQKEHDPINTLAVFKKHLLPNESTDNKVSACIIAYNQVEKITAAINSVLWADEIVVVDSHSTDGTTELALKLGVRVEQVIFNGFGNLRNKALTACQYEWIFSLDSDERCTPEVRDEILKIIHSNNAKDVYYVPRKNYFMGHWIKHSGWYPDYRQPQLFRRGCLEYEPDSVHENYICHTNNPVGYLKNPIWQIPFRNLSEMMQKANRYSTLSIDRLEKKYGKSSMVSAITHAMWTFIKHYLLQHGFLDGWPGFVIAMGHSYGAFYRYAKYYEKENQWPDLENKIIYKDQIKLEEKK